MQVLGIDVGGSGIKGALVDISTGLLASERYRLPTPDPSVPDAVGDVVAEVVQRFEWHGPIGCTFPSVIREGVIYTAANVDSSWIGTDGHRLLQQKTNCPVLLLNDADAAGIAEMEFGAGRGNKGVVIMLTFGTGIGTAVFTDGHLLPNTELGHIEIRGKEAEWRASDYARQKKDLSWKKWAKRVNEYLGQLEGLLWPDLFIIGGGASKNHAKFLPLLKTRAQLTPAQMLNEAGIVGAAFAARVLV
jgi:polyphosphate glucokinase